MLVIKVYILIFHILHIERKLYSYQCNGLYFFQNEAQTKFILNEVSDFRNSSHYTNDHCVYVHSFHNVFSLSTSYNLLTLYNLINIAIFESLVSYGRLSFALVMSGVTKHSFCAGTINYKTTFIIGVHYFIGFEEKVESVRSMIRLNMPHQGNMYLKQIHVPPKTLPLYRETGVCRGIPNFLISDPNHTSSRCGYR